MKKPSKATLQSEAYDRANIARAVKYSVFLRIGPRERYQEYAATIPAAQAIARQWLNLKDRYGRIPIIYAITPEEWTVPLMLEDQVKI